LSQEHLLDNKLSQHYFHLSGLHDALPTCEVLSVFESENVPYQVNKRYDSCLVAECSESSAIIIAQRAAYCRRAVKLLHQNKMDSQSIEELAEEISSVVDFAQHIQKDETFLVRVYRIHDASIDYMSETLEVAIGKKIWNQLEGKNKAKMKNPDITFVILFVDDTFLFGKELFARKSGSFDDRRADIRPFFKPGTLEPRFARLMVNLSQASSSTYLLDPFCGPGGILVEGSLMGCNVIGMDIDKRMILGAQQNLLQYSPAANYNLLVGDAKALPFLNRIHSIATDPPYGRSTSTYGKTIVELLNQFFSEAHQVLTNKGILAIGMLVEIPLEDLAKTNGFKLEVFEQIYIHRSLTRRVGVFRKI